MRKRYCGNLKKAVTWRVGVKLGNRTICALDLLWTLQMYLSSTWTFGDASISVLQSFGWRSCLPHSPSLCWYRECLQCWFSSSETIDILCQNKKIPFFFFLYHHLSAVLGRGVAGGSFKVTFPKLEERLWFAQCLLDKICCRSVLHGHSKCGSERGTWKKGDGNWTEFYSRPLPRVLHLPHLRLLLPVPWLTGQNEVQVLK